MRDTPRNRRTVSTKLLRLLRPLFRYSTARDAYVLRVAGGRYGPVLVMRRPVPQPVVLSQPVEATGRFRREGADVADGADRPTTQTRQH